MASTEAIVTIEQSYGSPLYAGEPVRCMHQTQLWTAMSETSKTTSLAEAFGAARDMDAPLNARLAAYAAALRRLNRPFAEAVDHLVERLQATAAGHGAPKVGEPMPPFLLPDQAGRLTALAEIIAERPAAIVFHRGHWCPYCRMTNAALAALSVEAAHIGGRIIAITPDRSAFVRRLMQDSGARFPILTDIDNGYALSVGLAIWVGEELRAQMQSIGRDLGVYQGNDSWILPIPATFIVGRDGVVTARHVDPDYRVRMETEAILDALRKTAAQTE
jgi:peroxiredoxin